MPADFIAEYTDKCDIAFIMAMPKEGVAVKFPYIQTGSPVDPGDRFFFRKGELKLNQFK